jgi:signal transduction histidine kinase
MAQSNLDKNERQLTDESLSLERDKTNQSLLKEKDSAEKVTDESVIEKRIEADQTRLANRIEADSSREVEREIKNISRTDFKKIDDKIIFEERKGADEIVALERARVDAAFDQEREDKNKIEMQFLASERKQTDQNLRGERQKADSKMSEVAGLLNNEAVAHSQTKNALTTREEFLAVVSHDLKNPIGAIFSCGEMLLQESSKKELDPDVKRWITFIKRNADTALRLIKDLLEMERIAQGKLELKLEACSISLLVNESVESLNHSAGAKNIDIRVIQKDLNLKTVCDRDRINQILMNLIGNAIKFTPPKGSIIVDVYLADDQVNVSVKDTGCGIPQEKMAHIFDRFAQIGSVDRTGLGLGLYISKMLVEAHHGKIQIESQFGVGSTFYFSLPVAGPATV